VRLNMRPMHEGDLEHKVRWANDPEVNRWLVFPERVTLEGTRQWFAAQQRDPKLTLRTICCDDVAIGYLKLLRQGTDRGFYHGIAIGEPSYWGRGLGKEAIHQAQTIAFEELGWTRMWGYFATWNERSIAVHEQMGWRRVRYSKFRRPDIEGREQDVWIMRVVAPCR
jgi:RimJ/RimL family protein N-acetyltransferase